jgi:S-adenosylmethionine/arginine decarboxylase-like enzyme
LEETSSEIVIDLEKKEFERLRQDPWGQHTSMDIWYCNPETIRSAEKIKEYVVKLCDLIEMKRFGEPVVIHFGEDDRVAGYSMFQLIETSNIAGHFRNEVNSIYIDIFSCKSYDAEAAVKFTMEFFGSTDPHPNINHIVRF